MNDKIRSIAIYLPQYHPIPENNEWWENGFTEWTNVTKAKPLFKGHNQPNLPGELGFYDLRLDEVREQQATLAKEYGIEGFMYWHYWFAGRRILERPFQEVLETGKPNFPFCLGWANESWTGVWHGLSNQILIEQTYPGIEDHKNHFYNVLSALKDSRYITIKGKPIFYIYRPFQIPNVSDFIHLWRELAEENGLKGIYFIAIAYSNQEIQEILNFGFDGVNTYRMGEAAETIMNSSLVHRMKRKLFSYNIKWKYTQNGVFQYSRIIKQLIDEEDSKDNIYPTVLPNWDNSPRSGLRSRIVLESTPDLFRKHVQKVFSMIKNKPEENKIVFIKSWNEWAEGNYIEPDRKYGRQYLEVFKDELDKIR